MRNRVVAIRELSAFLLIRADSENAGLHTGKRGAVPDDGGEIERVVRHKNGLQSRVSLAALPHDTLRNRQWSRRSGWGDLRHRRCRPRRENDRFHRRRLNPERPHGDAPLRRRSVSGRNLRRWNGGTEYRRAQRGQKRNARTRCDSDLKMSVFAEVAIERERGFG